jgi:hypothetical protein
MLRALEQTQMSYHNVQAQVIAHALLGEADSRVFRCLADDRYAHAAIGDDSNRGNTAPLVFPKDRDRFALARRIAHASPSPGASSKASTSQRR